MHGANAQTTRFQRISQASHIEIPASERYENDFGKKAEKMAKEEKEAKKKVSIKNGECHVMTHMVKIEEEFDLDDVSDEEDDLSKYCVTPALVEVLKDKHLRPWGRISYARMKYKTSAECNKFYLFKYC